MVKERLRGRLQGRERGPHLQPWVNPGRNGAHVPGKNDHLGPLHGEGRSQGRPDSSREGSPPLPGCPALAHVEPVAPLLAQGSTTSETAWQSTCRPSTAKEYLSPWRSLACPVGALGLLLDGPVTYPQGMRVYAGVIALVVLLHVVGCDAPVWSRTLPPGDSTEDGFQHLTSTPCEGSPPTTACGYVKEPSNGLVPPLDFQTI
jgi:hypothetical protein